MIRWLWHWLWGSSVRRQLIAGVALVHMLLMSIFVFDLVHRQREFLVESAKSRVLLQAQLLASSSLHGAMSNDLGALSEIIGVLAHDKGIARAMVTDTRGRVLASTEAGKIGLFRNDQSTLAVLRGAPQSVLVDEGSSRSFEAAAPIVVQDRVVGWAWVARNLGAEQAHLAYVTRAGLVYTAAAILIGTLFAFLLARMVTRQLRLLLVGTERVAANRLDQDVAVTTENEVGQVTRAFNDAMHKLSEQQLALRESEEQFRELAEGIPQLAWTANPDGWIYWYNQRWYQYTGTTPKQMEGWGWQSVHDPIELPKVMERWKVSIGTGEPFDMVFPLRGADGVFRPFLTRIMPLRDTQGRVVRWFGTNTDISEQRRTEEQLQKLNRTLTALSNSNQALMHATNEPTLLQEVCRIVSEDCGHAMVWIGFAENDENKTVRPVAHAGFEEGYLETMRITWADNERGRGPTGTAIRTGQPSMCRNMLTDPAYLPWREEAVKRGYACSLVVPLKEDDKTFGAITIYSREQDTFTEGEASLLTELAGDLSYGIGTLRMRAAHDQAEEALRSSQAKLQGIVGSAMDAVISVNDEQQIVVFNQSAEAIFQCAAPEALGCTLDRFIPEALREVHREHIRQYGRKGVTARSMNSPGILTAVRSNGEEFPIEATISQVQAAGEKLFTVILRDITERKQAEEALRRQAELMRLSFDAIIVWRLRGAIESWNLGAEQLYGYSESEALGRVTHELLRTTHPVLWLEIEARLRDSGNWEGELHHITKEGSEITVSARLQLIVSADGVERILETNRDITERKQAERSLRQSEERWSTTLQSIGDAVISTDANGRVMFMNAVAEKLTGWSLSEAQGHDLEEVFNIVSEVTRMKPESPVAKVIRLGQVVGLANHTALINRNGAELPIEDSGAPIRDNEGYVTGVVLVFHDVSEKKRAEKALRDSERLATTGRMASTLAHEIHNPLDTVGSLLYLIDSNPNVPEAARHQAAMASEEVTRVTQMTRHMLSFQREAKSPVPIKIGDVLDNVLALYERKIESAAIKVEKQVDFEGEFIGLPGEMRQVFANLIGNAIEAIGKNGKIRLHAYASTDWSRGRRGLRVTVTDNGPGIPAEARDKIFEPFFTTKGEAGTGLGLWIISGIVGNNNGMLRLRTVTRDGRSGTCFSVFFPFAV